MPLLSRGTGQQLWIVLELALKLELGYTMEETEELHLLMEFLKPVKLE